MASTYPRRFRQHLSLGQLDSFTVGTSSSPWLRCRRHHYYHGTATKQAASTLLIMGIAFCNAHLLISSLINHQATVPLCPVCPVCANWSAFGHYKRHWTSELVYLYWNDCRVERVIILCVIKLALCLLGIAWSCMRCFRKDALQLSLSSCVST